MAFALECRCPGQTPLHQRCRSAHCPSFVLEERKPTLPIKEEEEAAPKKREAIDQSRKVEKRSPPAEEAKPGIHTLAVRVVSRL